MKKKWILLFLVLTMTVWTLPVLAGTTTQVLLSADFESFAENANVWSLGWYNDTDNRGYSDFAAQTDITGGKMGVGGKYRTVNDITANNGHVTILKENENKYLASAVRAESNYIGFVLDNPIKAPNLTLSFDAFMPADGTKAALRFVYDSNGTKEVSKLIDWIADYGSIWLYTPSGSQKSYQFDSIKGKWVTYTLGIDLESRSYTYQLSTKDGTVLDNKTGLTLPETTGQNLYGFEFYFTPGNTADYFGIDNIVLSQTEQKNEITVSKSGAGSVDINGVAYENGQAAEVDGESAALSVQAGDGYFIKRIAYDGQALKVDEKQTVFTATLPVAKSAVLEVVFQPEEDSTPGTCNIDFESFSPGDKGQSGMGMFDIAGTGTLAVPGGTMGIYGKGDGTDNSLAVIESGEAGNYLALYGYADTKQIGAGVALSSHIPHDNVILSFDAQIQEGGAKLDIQPYFCNPDGSGVDRGSFLTLTATNGILLNNKSTLLTKEKFAAYLGKWLNYKIKMNEEGFLVTVTDKTSGAVIAKNEAPYQTWLQGLDDLYGAIFLILDSSGAATEDRKSAMLDNVSFYPVGSEKTQIQVNCKEGASFSLNSQEIEAGKPIDAAEEDLFSVTALEGYSIASVIIGDQMQILTDDQFFSTPLSFVGYEGFLGITVIMSTKGSASGPRQLYVATDGDDTGDGSFAHPFATLEKARDTIRGYQSSGMMPEGGVTVYLRGGTYFLTQSFTLDGYLDSGTESAPITYRPYQDEKVTLSGGKLIDFSAFSNVQGEMRDRLIDEAAKDKVMVADFDNIGLDQFDQIPITDGNSTIASPLFIFDNQVLKLVRWPNTDDSSQWPRAKTINRGFCTRWAGQPESTENGTGYSKMSFTTDRSDLWNYNQPDMIWFGNWRYEWYAEAFYGTMNQQEKTIEASTYLLYGTDSGYLGGDGLPFRIYNVYEELDEAGEWYVDRQQRKFYFYPYETDKKQPVFKMASADFDLVTMKNTSYVQFYGLEFTGGKQNGITMTGGTGNQVRKCSINTMEKIGFLVYDGTNNGISDSEIYNCGAGAITLRGGDKQTITPAGNYAKNNDVHDFSLLKTTYACGVDLDGVGNIVSHNEFYNAPHLAILFHGVDNIIEYNDFHNVVSNAADMGIIYTGRSLADHGNIIRYNYFHDCPLSMTEVRNPTNGIFSDDGSCDTEIFGNVFGKNMSQLQIMKFHGGFANIARNNVVLDAKEVFFVADWHPDQFSQTVAGTYSRNGSVDKTFHNTWMTIKGNQHYYDRWPWLKQCENPETIGYIPNVFGQNAVFYIDETYDRAMCWRVSMPNYVDIHIVGEKETNTLFTKPNEDYTKYFEDYENGNLALTDEAYAVIRQKSPNFTYIPFSQMGRQAIQNQAPVIQSIEITSGEDALTASYCYLDAEGDLEGDTKIIWLASDSAGGAYRQVGEGATLPLTDDLLSVKVAVIPADDRGNIGQTYTSAPYFAVGSRESLERLLGSMEQEYDGSETGTSLGQYPQNARDAFAAAIASAKEQAGGAADFTALTKELLDAFEIFKAEQVTSVAYASDQLRVPAGLKRLEVTLKETDRFQLVTTEPLPDTVIHTTLNGTDVVFALPAGTDLNGLLFEKLDALSADSFLTTAFVIKTAGVDMEITVSDTLNMPYTIENGSLAKITPKIVEQGQAFSFAGGELAFGKPFVPGTDATLADIRVNGKSVSRFEPGKLEYKYTLAKDAAQWEVTATASDPNATVTIVQAESPDQTVLITVTAQDKKTTLTYKVQLSQKQETNTPSPTYAPLPTNGGNGNGNGGGIGNSSGAGNITGIGTGEFMQTPVFADTAGHWAREDIEEMYRRGIVSGVTQSTFEPDRDITRAEFAALVTRALELSATEAPDFLDVPADCWYADEVRVAAAVGMISGYEGMFRPEERITREEMTVILVKAYQFRGGTIPGGPLGAFGDRDKIAPWALPYVEQAVGAGLISGMTADTFAPAENATRAQAVSVLRRLLDS